jgi:hypothetical protein
MRLLLLSCLLSLGQAPPAAQPQRETENKGALDESAYFAFVDREFIFTLEFVKPGVPLFNFVSMVEEEHVLQAKEIRLALENRKVPGKYFVIDTGDPKEPLIVPSLQMRPRSSFGVRLQGDYGDAREIFGAAVRIGNDEFNLVPLSSFDFENLALKVNRINLGSPDFRDDWRVLKLEVMGSREKIRRR